MRRKTVKLACMMCNSTNFYLRAKTRDRVVGAALTMSYFGFPLGAKYLTGKRRYCADCDHHEFYYAEV